MTETVVEREIRDGDVFRFAYSEASWERARRGIGHGDLRWCFDGQLVMLAGRLRDTYWTFGAGDGRSFTPEEARAAGTLTFVVNLNDVREVRQEDLRYYAEEDCYDLRYQHGCYKKFAIRTGAQRSPERMLRWIDERVAELRGEQERVIRSTTFDLMRLAEQRVKIAAGDLEVHL